MSSLWYYEPFYDFDRLLDEALSTRWPAPSTQMVRRGREEAESAARAVRPRMDLHENTEKNEVKATFELPGLKKDDVQINVHNGRLTVSGESKASEEYDEGGFAVRERRFGKFSRSLQLPQGVKETEIKAHMDNGVLEVCFPKTTPEQAPKRITVE